MYLEKLQCKKLGKIRNLDLSFVSEGKPRMWTALIGKNGTHKTAILQIITMLAYGVTKSIMFMNNSRFVPVLKNSKLSANFRLSNGESVSSEILHKNSSLFGESIQDGSNDKNILDTIRFSSIPRLEYFVACYRGGGRLSNPYRQDLRDPCQHNPVRSMFSEFVPYANAWMSLFHLYDQEEKQKIFHDIMTYVIVTLFEDFRSLNLDPNLIGHHFIYQGKDKIPLTALSAGYQSLLCWIFDLIGNQIYFSKKPITSTQEMLGLVLIDDFDLHLHPSMQIEVASKLRKIFPQIQFVISTHNPLLLSNFAPHEIVYLGSYNGIVHK